MEYRSFAVALALMPLMAVAYSISKMYQAAFEAMGKNPACAKEVSDIIIIGAAFIEICALFIVLALFAVL